VDVRCVVENELWSLPVGIELVPVIDSWLVKSQYLLEQFLSYQDTTLGSQRKTSIEVELLQRAMWTYISTRIQTQLIMVDITL
jgi:hypothetical protein